MWCAALVVGFLAVCLATPQLSAATALTPEQKAEVENVIREYLLKNPELLEEVANELEKRRKLQAENEAKLKIVEYKDEIYKSKFDYISNPEGSIPFVEFFDYQCGYCKRVFPSIVKLRKRKPDVRIIYKEFPILGPVSVIAARAAIASRMQDKYVPFHDAMMRHKGRLNEGAIMTIAAGVGLDIDRLKADMTRNEVQKAIDANIDLAQRMNIRGTPAMIIGENLVPGAIAYRQMERLIDEAHASCTVC